MVSAGGDPSGSLAEFLSQVDVLGGLAPEVRTSLAGHSRILRLRRGSIVFVQRDRPSLYVVLRGRVALLSRPLDGIEVQISARRRGDLIGEVSLFLGKQIHEARAVESTLLARLDAVAVRDAVSADTDAACRFGELLARRVAFTEARLGEVAIHGVRERLLLLLPRLALRAESPHNAGADLAIDRLTHEELARLIGAGRVAVTRALRQLVDDGWIRFKGRQILLLRRFDGRACVIARPAIAG